MNPPIQHQQVLAFSTRTGLSLGYDFAKAKRRLLMTWETENFLKALTKKKEQRPRIDAFSGSLKGIFLDFDDLELVSKLLPATTNPTWEEVANWMTNKLSSNGCVFRSASGKVKVFCPINVNAIDQKQAKLYVAKAFGELYDYLDSKGGFRYSFVDTSAYQIIKQYLNSYEYELALNHNTIQFNSITEEREKKEVGILYENYRRKSFSWNLFYGDIPQSLMRQPRNHLLLQVFRFISGSFYLSTACGIALPQHRMAELFGVSQRAIGKTIERLVRLGVIRKTASHCHAAGLAARFKFDGFYLEWARNELQKILTRKATNRRTETVKVARSATESLFREGQMNRALFLYTRFFDDLETYLDACTAQPYFGRKPEHDRQARSAWASHQRRLARKQGLELVIGKAA